MTFAGALCNGRLIMRSQLHCALVLAAQEAKDLRRLDIETFTPHDIWRDWVRPPIVFNAPVRRHITHRVARLFFSSFRWAMERKAAYEAVQRAAMKTWEGAGTFPENVAAEPSVAHYLSQGEIARLCSLELHFRHVDDAFRKVGLE